MTLGGYERQGRPQCKSSVFYTARVAHTLGYLGSTGQLTAYRRVDSKGLRPAQSVGIGRVRVHFGSSYKVVELGGIVLATKVGQMVDYYHNCYHTFVENPRDCLRTTAVVSTVLRDKSFTPLALWWIGRWA